MNIASPLRRWNSIIAPQPTKVRALRDDHAALHEARTIFPSTVVNASDSPRLLVSAFNNRKIGGQVQKGEWAGMPIYTLTLEERATCPTQCANWGHCYGNAMHMARRHRHGPDLEARLQLEVAMLAREHPRGFVVRLHVLGDFYSVEYGQLWLDLLYRYEQLRIFGYTARTMEHDAAIAETVLRMNARFPARCFIRTTMPYAMPGGAVVARDETPIVGGIICPAETSKTACCSTCSLCWTPSARDKAIVFILHGNPWGGRPPIAKASIAMPDSDWIELQPMTERPTDEPRATVRVYRVGKRQTAIATFSFNRALTAGLPFKPEPKKRYACRVGFGTGALRGRIRVAIDPKGPFNLTCMSQALRLVMGLKGNPTENKKAVPIEHAIRDGALILNLPAQLVDHILTPDSFVPPRQEVIPAAKRVGSAQSAEIPASKATIAEPVAKASEAPPMNRPPPAVPAPPAPKPAPAESIAELVEKFNAKPKPKVEEPEPGEPAVRVVVAGNYVTIGQTPSRLRSDQVAICKALVENFGQTVPRAKCATFVNDPDKAISGLRITFHGSPFEIKSRANGWALCNKVES